MRYQEIISEAITNKPRNLGLYVRNRIKELNAVIAQRDRATEMIETNRPDGESMLIQWLRLGS